MAVAVGSQTKMWGWGGSRQCERQRVIKSYSKVSITGFSSSHFPHGNHDGVYTVRKTLGIACVDQIQEDELCCKEEAIYDQYCISRDHYLSLYLQSRIRSSDY
ncbi:uncharacterized protein CCOS01_17123 [Colletotrichum costaricense]|uniref:Uncharacterized protein n=1 Tax=Colletotrichum costaricense TaxID=1209916 RepID=A0AAI9YEF3_9PEZI|nr:uncharacterized protein CCOS01_17123 [Colletotrichum costaricense]KAK1502263.1 hypothetical protein CCOS01_17123 [Colletotrichum costaricense]